MIILYYTCQIFRGIQGLDSLVVIALAMITGGRRFNSCSSPSALIFQYACSLIHMQRLRSNPKPIDCTHRTTVRADQSTFKVIKTKCQRWSDNVRWEASSQPGRIWQREAACSHACLGKERTRFSASLVQAILPSQQRQRQCKDLGHMTDQIAEQIIAL